MCIALYVYDEDGDRLRARLGIGDRYRLPIDENIVLYVVAVPVAGMAITTMILAGHSCAHPRVEDGRQRDSHLRPIG